VTAGLDRLRVFNKHVLNPALLRLANGPLCSVPSAL
jgi:hypothetical protein